MPQARRGTQRSNWVKGTTVRSVVDVFDLVSALTGDSNVWSTRAVEYMITELRKEVWKFQTVGWAKS